MTKKKNFSMKGWEFGKWAAGNLKSVKEVAKVAGPLVLGWIATQSPEWAGFCTILGKFLLDSLEYWIKARN